MTSGQSVTSSRSRLAVSIPLRKQFSPDSISARLVTHSGHPLVARVNTVPRRTRSSRFGVWISGFPSAAIVSGR